MRKIIGNTVTACLEADKTGISTKTVQRRILTGANGKLSLKTDDYVVSIEMVSGIPALAICWRWGSTVGLG